MHKHKKRDEHHLSAVAHNPNPRQYLTAAHLRERYGGRSGMWIERIMQRDARFPRPIYIGRLRFWALDEIEAYERAAAAAGKTTKAE